MKREMILLSEKNVYGIISQPCKKQMKIRRKPAKMLAIFSPGY